MTNNIDTQSMLRVGTILHGTYSIERYLSSGGFGNTYVAVHTEFNERYAVKEFFMKGITQRDGDSITVSVSNAANQSQFAEQKEKFKKEARRLRGLSNPHVVKVYDLFEENGTVYYVMDFIDGESLSERLKRLGTPLSEAEVNQYLPQILDALECVHGQQIWHLDLKPANIMVDKSSVIKLIDFGASKQIRPDGGATTSTALCFTPGYAPSEQIGQNMKKFGPWTDFYALGATIYNMLTMNRPPEPLDISEDGEGAFAFNSNISINLRQLIIWLMQPDRIKRPQNVDEIREKLSIKKSEAPEPTNETPTEKVNTMGGDATVLNGSVPPDDNTKVLPKDESFAHLLVEAQNGNTEAQISVANCYYYGKNDVNIDISKALYWWNLAAEKGNAQAQYYLGWYYYDKGNIDKAKLWLGKSANNSYKYAIDLLKQISDKESDGEHGSDSSHKIYYWAFLIFGLIILLLWGILSLSHKGSDAPSLASGGENGHEYVDLGLSVKWATCNIGASCCSDYGGYYAWGETKTKKKYSYDNYIYYYKGEFCLNIGTDIKGTKYDVAHVLWGGLWRMPTKEECIELTEKCKWKWYTQNNHKGYLITGPNGNSIFLPAAGQYSDGELYSVNQEGNYYTSTLSSGTNDRAETVYFRVDWICVATEASTGLRPYGQSIRPVLDKN